MKGIEVKNFYKKFGNFTAVHDVSFTAGEGELVALLGPSGSGKSTILRMIAGLETPDRGQAYFDGEDVTHLAIQQRNVGFVFQHYALFKHMTVEKNIAFGLEILKKDGPYIREKVEELIDLVNLNGYEKHFPAQLSGGQRQRVALARALAPEPRMMLLDEPFGSLDAKVRENLANWIRELHQRINLTSIFVTHDQSEAIKIADKIVALNRGTVEQIGTAKQIYENPQNKFVASFIGNSNIMTGTIQDKKLVMADKVIPWDVELSAIPEGGLVVLMIRPEDIMISLNKADQCSLRGMIKDIFYRGNGYEVLIKMDRVSIRAFESKRSLQRRKIKKGCQVYVGFSKLRIFGAPEGEKKIRENLSHLGYIG